MGIVTSVLCNRNKASLEGEDELKVYEIVEKIYATNYSLIIQTVLLYA
jgi:hypothetical protein